MVVGMEDREQRKSTNSLLLEQPVFSLERSLVLKPHQVLAMTVLPAASQSIFAYFCPHADLVSFPLTSRLYCECSGWV